MGLDTKMHAATMALGKIGIIHGMKTYVLKDANDEISEVYSISAGLDYPGVGPEHSHLREINRVTYQSITDSEAVDAFILTSKLEGIIPAIESSHALAYAYKLLPTLDKDKIVVVNLSGRGDKDVKQVAKYLGHTLVD